MNPREGEADSLASSSVESRTFPQTPGMVPTERKTVHARAASQILTNSWKKLQGGLKC